MKTKLLISFLFCIAVGGALSSRMFPNSSVAGGLHAAAGAPDQICTKAGQFCVNRETSSGTCHVQEATESPLGVNIKGPFKNRADGNAAMCTLYDPGSADPAKCGAVAPQGVCDASKPPRR
jgi:hypothetical protein